MDREREIENLLHENTYLREKLQEAEETLYAIQYNQVDAFVVSKPHGKKIYTLKSTNQSYNILLEMISEGTAILAPEQIIFSCNSRFGEILKARPESLKGMSLLQLMPHADRDRFISLLQTSESGSIRDEVNLQANDGTLIPVQLALSPLQVEQMQGACLVIADLSRQKKIEEQLRLYMTKLEQSNQDLQDFASIASHDLQEPLRKVRTFGNILKEVHGTSLGEEGREHLERMIDATSRMQSLLESILSYSRVTTRQKPFTEVKLNQLVKEVLSDLEVRIKQTEGIVEVGELPTVHADPHQMRQLFQNLISNALKFNKEGEKPIVRIYEYETDNEQGHHRIVVEDNGIGFEEKYLDKVFAPFQRLHGRSSRYEGTGMGLAICKKIVERHGGWITARSEPGKGTVFMVSLPETKNVPS